MTDIQYVMTTLHSKLCDFHDGFHTKQQHFPLSSAPAPCFFSQLYSHMRQFEPLTEQLWLHYWHHFKTFMHAHQSLSNETIIVQDCWIRNTVVCM